jgi:hypothetical protein
LCKPFVTDDRRGRGLPPRHAALQHAQALAVERAERVMALAIWAICFCVAKIANATIGVLAIAKRVAPCARRGLVAPAQVIGAGHWHWSLVI